MKCSFSRVLSPLNNDTNVLKFGEDMSGYEYAKIYVEHMVDEPIVIIIDEVSEFVKPIQEPLTIDLDDDVQVEEREEVQVEEKKHKVGRWKKYKMGREKKYG